MFRGVRSFVAIYVRILLQKLKKITNKMPRNERVGLADDKFQGNSLQ